MDVDFAKALWKSADAVCFDVDSTVCTGEIIDQLARFLGKEKEISKLTSKAMGGDISFRESLKLRLQLMQPSLELVIRFLKGNPIDLTPGIRPLISMLQARSVDVYLLTGGFTHFVDRIAEELGVPLKNVYANKLLFDENGLYSGFDETVPTSKDDGKRVICGQLKELHGYERLIMVGDGMTDACASPPADVFIGFGGNQVRQAVVNKAHWYVYSFQELTDVLNN
uniref:Phosphoserine phosphatase n=1 Tax=Trichuris muris TaxID=70415 RepID=A0A5S6QS12_TRIMR